MARIIQLFKIHGVTLNAEGVTFLCAKQSHQSKKYLASNKALWCVPVTLTMLQRKPPADVQGWDEHSLGQETHCTAGQLHVPLA